MRILPPKSIGILIGIIFFAGGAFIVGAQSMEAEISGSGVLDNSTALVAAQKTATTQPAPTDPLGAINDDKNLEGISCNPLTLNFKGCIPLTVYYLIYKPTSYLMIGAGYIFDKTIALSIDKNFVDQQFVVDSWKIIRDFSNMLFIFILLYTGISTMLGMGNWRKTVIQVIIIALLINFSLFFTKVIIDAGNILATGIYSSINTGASFSGSLAGKFQPQVFLNAAGTIADPMNSVIVFIIAAIVNIFAAWVFFKAALLFIGRLLAFWLLMIVSPFAFISTTFPKGDKFQDWIHLLTAQAFVAPVFLFLLYIIMQVISAGNGVLSSLGGSSGSSWFDKLIAPILIAVLIILALQRSLKFAEGMAGELGNLGAKIGGAVMGVAGGVALGGAGLLGRKVIGGAAKRALDSGKYQEMAKSGNMLNRFRARTMIGLSDKASKATFDARGIGVVQKGIGALDLGASKYLGVDATKVSKGAAGGYAGMAKRQGEADEAHAKLYGVTEEEKEKIKAEAKERKKITAEKEAAAQKAYDESETGQKVKVAEAEVVAIQKVAEEAVKKIDEAQKAYDTGYTSTGSEGDLKLVQDLHNAKEAAKATEGELSAKQAELVTATTKHAASQAAVDLTLAKISSEKAKKDGEEDNLKAKIALMQKDRMEAYASRLESGAGRLISWRGAGEGGLGLTYSHSQAKRTAAKIREGKTKEEREKEEEDKILKRLAKKDAEKRAKEKEGEGENVPPKGSAETH